MATTGATVKHYVVAWVIVSLIMYILLRCNGERESPPDSSKAIPLESTPLISPPYYTPQEPNSRPTWKPLQCEKQCSNHGYCFLGKCFCNADYEGDHCDIPTHVVIPPCTNTNDSCFVAEYGVGIVSTERWRAAQAQEAAIWTGNTGTDDRAGDHLEGFHQYKLVPDNLGEVLELGCGPWTQSKPMLATRDSFKLESICLWDPGLLGYVLNTPKCSYKSGTLDKHKTILVNAGGEDLKIKEGYDVVILINVLEHVQNAFLIMENVYNAIKPGGIYIFHDRYWDKYAFYSQGVGPTFGHLGMDRGFHPIRLKKKVFDHYLSFFEPIFVNHEAKAVLGRGEQGVYFIGRKKLVE